MQKQDLIRRLVEDFNEEPFQPKYRGENYGTPIFGWGARLRGYFWPTPKLGYKANHDLLQPLTIRGADLADAYSGGWSAEQRTQAVRFANDIFNWGRVRQKEVNPEIVSNVFDAALTNRNTDAPMNSGWTKVAALATAHLESADRAHVIWDSRVSHSLVARIDRLLAEKEVSHIPTYLKGLGRVPGRGGARKEVRYVHRWPHAYGRWDSQIAASAFVREIRDELNRNQISAPQPQGGNSNWTVRSVEMVLFMDGY